MALAEAKMKILEKMWEGAQPMRPKDVAQRTGLKVSATTMHLLQLKREGYVFTPRSGYYAITDFGKEAIGLPKIDRAEAVRILGQVSVDKAFHFYEGMHQYIGVYAKGLADFSERIQKISDRSIEFHVSRRDFENWIESLGDVELSKRMSVIRNLNLTGDDLRKKVSEAVRLRVEDLKRLLA